MLVNLMLMEMQQLIEKENQVCIPNGKLLSSVHQIKNFFLKVSAAEKMWLAWMR